MHVTFASSRLAARVKHAMLTRDRLEEAFVLYRRELQALSVHKCYLSALHLLCAIPDVCGALQSLDGEATGERYRSWCREYLPCDETMKPADWYKMRCSVLHQGSSLPTDPRGERSQYASISFAIPENSFPGAHRYVQPSSTGTNITLEITGLATEMLAGLSRWFDWLLKPENEATAITVEDRLRTVVSPRPKTYPREAYAREDALLFVVDTWSST